MNKGQNTMVLHYTGEKKSYAKIPNESKNRAYKSEGIEIVIIIHRFTSYSKADLTLSTFSHPTGTRTVSWSALTQTLGSRSGGCWSPVDKALPMDAADDNYIVKYRHRSWIVWFFYTILESVQCHESEKLLFPLFVSGFLVCFTKIPPLVCGERRWKRGVRENSKQR